MLYLLAKIMGRLDFGSPMESGSKGFIQIHNDAWAKYCGNNTHNWYYVPFHYKRDNYGNGRTGSFYYPELGRFLRENDLDNIKKDYSERLIVKEGGNHSIESWYIIFGDQIYGFSSSTGGENCTMGPDFSWTLYMIQADIFNASREQLSLWLDIPFTMAGDSYCINKYVRALEAFGRETWVKL